VTDSRIIRAAITRADLNAIAERQFGDMVKAVVDIDRQVMAIGAELHSDEEATLLEDGSRQPALWGVNLYPGETADAFLEYDSMINVRPASGNRTRGVEDEAMRARILAVVRALVSDA
jgi:hypothetical protein